MNAEIKATYKGYRKDNIKTNRGMIMAVKKCFSVIGYHNSGKTLLIESIIPELKTLGFSVSTIKHATHFELENDKANGDSERLFLAGSKMSIALSDTVTQIHTTPTRLRSAFSYINTDILIIEGFKGEAIPNIVRAKNTQDAKELINELTIATVTDNGETIEEGIPSFKPEQTKDIAELALERSFPPLPLLNCGHCKGGTCFNMASLILKGEGSLEDCVVLPSTIKLKINNTNIPLNPFVRQIISAVVTSLIGVLKDTPKDIKEVKLHMKL